MPAFFFNSQSRGSLTCTAVFLDGDYDKSANCTASPEENIEHHPPDFSCRKRVSSKHGKGGEEALRYELLAMIADFEFASYRRIVWPQFPETSQSLSSEQRGNNQHGALNPGGRFGGLHNFLQARYLTPTVSAAL